jgi:hypothetical protein
MKDERPQLKDLTLRDVMWPGSHDAGMSFAKDLTLGASTGNVVTQMHTIREQLDLGIRLFDIRPNIKHNKLICAHVNFCGDVLRWQGGFGESIADVVNGINDFTSAHVGECVILHVHDFCGFSADVPDYPDPATSKWKEGYWDYKNFSHEQWERLYKELEQLQGLFMVPEKSKASHLSTYKWVDVVPENGSTVIVVMSNSRGEEEQHMSARQGRGFFKSDQWYPKESILWMTVAQSDYQAAMTSAKEVAFYPGKPVVVAFDWLAEFLSTGRTGGTETILEMAERAQPGQIEGARCSMLLPVRIDDGVKLQIPIVPSRPVVQADRIVDRNVAAVCLWWMYTIERLKEIVATQRADQQQATLDSYFMFVMKRLERSILQEVNK